MNEEQIKFEGRLAQKLMISHEMRLRIQGLVKSLRDLLDPTVPEEELNGPLISAQAIDLSNRLIDYADIIKQIKVIKKALGRE